MAYKKKTMRRRTRRTPRTFRRQTRKTYRRSRYSPNKLSKSVSTTFPNSLLAKFTYTDSKLYSPLAGLGTYNQYSATSLYDPDLTGAGTQVLYYTELINSSLYRFYKVYGCKVTITMVNESNFPCTAQIGYGIRSTLSTIIAPSTTNVDTYSSAKRNFIVNLGASTGAKNIRTIKLWIDPAQVNGKTRKSYMSDTDFDYAYGNNPIPSDNYKVDYFVNILGGVPAGSNVTPSVSVTVKNQYYAKLHDFGANTEQT